MVIAASKTTPNGVINHQYILTDVDGVSASMRGSSTPDRSVHVFGSFNSGTVTIEGSNEETPLNWAVLHDPQGTPLTFTAAGIEAVSENTQHIRVVMTGTVGVAAVTVIFSGGVR